AGGATAGCTAALVRAAGERGCALLVDDLHAAPDATVHAVASLAATAAAHRLLVVACWRPSEARAALQAAAADLRERRHATVLELEPDAVAARPATRYATTADGASIAFQVVGDGPRDVVLVPGFVSNVEHAWEMPTARRMMRRLAARHRLIVWDKRGTGLSDPVTRVPTLEERALDLAAVLDATGARRPVLLGISEGGPMALHFAAHHADRVAALVVYGTAPSFVRDARNPQGWDPGMTEDLTSAMFEHWGTGTMLRVFSPSLAADPAAREAFGRFQRTGASPAMGRAMVRAMLDIDVRDLLPRIRVPTLVLHRVEDRLIHADGGRAIAAGVPGAAYVELPGTDHFPWLGDMDDVVDELEAFLDG
ncbi:MAG: alpha/beta fold hydrolase, partial [Solirubrobacterales bacterium]|nr:alpha/beta fold hydrolase [Solirubrobacterales bacterium]